ncbi:MAG TPA: hypothetical protein VM621_09810 [Luteibacter sp.]|uniref:hypothetical protein n=1 Tax=Luteibacter sp. TaxID=1886636 RepID=UPI002C2833A6|nr:hypothetical protein [Luteibacter sp.]HVI55334.1 hypothetical protein [Luteibacter sp.]
MPAERLRRLAGLLFGAFCAVAFGFAAGAVWMVPSMMFGRALPALVLPVGWVLGIVVRRWLRIERGLGSVLAAVATLVAAAYTACLVAAATISGMMGIGFGQTIHDAGASMLLELARLAQGPWDLVLYLAGALLAGLVAWPIARRSTGGP